MPSGGPHKSAGKTSVTNQPNTATVSPVGSPRVLPYGDSMRVVGLFAVVLLHCADPAVFLFDSAPRINWWVCNTIKCTMLWAVPVFVMLSGALMLDPAKQENWSVFFRKRFMRVGVPLLFWSGVYLIWSRVYMGNPVGLGGAVRSLVLGTPKYHLYFLFVMAGLYLVTPALRVFVRHASRQELLGAAVVALAVACGNQVIQTGRGHLLFDLQNGLARFVPFVGYFLMGYFLRDLTMSRGGRVAAWCVLVVCVAVSVVGARVALGALGRPGGLIFYWYLNPFCIVGSISVFLILAARFAHPSGRFVGRVIGWLAPLVLGVYLLQPAVLDVFYRQGFTTLRPDMIGLDLGVRVLGSFVICTVAVWVIRLVPGLRRVVG